MIYDLEINEQAGERLVILLIESEVLSFFLKVSVATRCQTADIPNQGLAWVHPC